MPRKAATHIHSTAPGPPMTMAAATPAMLPVPMVAARAVQRAWNWEMDCLSVFLVEALSFLKREPMVSFHQWPSRVTWNTLVPRVSSRPVPISSTRPGTPQIKVFRIPLISVIFSRMFIFLPPQIKNESPKAIRPLSAKKVCNAPRERFKNFVLLPERFGGPRLAPSALNSMSFSKVMSACSLHPRGKPESVTPSAALLFLQASAIIFISYIILPAASNRKGGNCRKSPLPFSLNCIQVTNICSPEENIRLGDALPVPSRDTAPAVSAAPGSCPLCSPT